ncbi:hypothetical protein OEZ86_000919 [Tetradesmus obliquus]|nr:hypothetical protein OEZ86_000919 [Tetradesmus obliquus]
MSFDAELSPRVTAVIREKTTYIAAYDRNSSKTSAINVLDLPAFLLARYATVAEVEKELQQKLQVVSAPYYNVLGSPSCNSSCSTAAAPQELDAAAQLDSRRQAKRPEVATARRLQQPSRFTRMAMVRAAALATCWPTLAGNESQLLSPGTLPGRQYPQHNPALLAVLGITQTVYLPRGIDDYGQANSAEPSDWEVTPYSTLRDHTAKVFFYRTGNNVMYRSVSLASAAWPQGEGAFSHTPLVPPQQSWAIDTTSTLFSPQK